MKDDPSYRAPLSPTGGPVKQIDILWLSAGLSCDGDTIAITAATQPSIEDLVLGSLPWVPKVQLSQPVPRIRKRR